MPQVMLKDDGGTFLTLQYNRRLRSIPVGVVRIGDESSLASGIISAIVEIDHERIDTPLLVGENKRTVAMDGCDGVSCQETKRSQRVPK